MAKHRHPKGTVVATPPFNLTDAHNDSKLQRAIEQARMGRLNVLQRLADPWERREYYLFGPVTAEAASDLVGTLDHWWRIDSQTEDGNRKFRIVLNSYTQGPSIIPTIAIYDFLSLMKQRGFEITIEIAGHASAHAAILVQAASPGRRLAGPRSYMSIEQLKHEFSLNSLALEHRARWINQLQRQYYRLIVQHTDCIDADDVKKETIATPWLLKAKQAKALGLIDDIVSPRDIQNLHCLIDPPLFAAEDSFEVRLQKAELVRNASESTLLRLDAFKRETDDETACVHRLFTGVTTDSVTEAVKALSRFTARCDTSSTLYINSPGGSIVDGAGYYDRIKLAQAGGHAVDTVCMGYAASMGGVLLQAGTRRIIGAESWVLIHRAAGWFEGTTEEINSGNRRLNRLQNECFEILASRTKGKLTVSDIRKRCDRGDWWLPARLAKKLGLVDLVF